MIHNGRRRAIDKLIMSFDRKLGYAHLRLGAVWSRVGLSQFGCTTWTKQTSISCIVIKQFILFKLQATTNVNGIAQNECNFPTKLVPGTAYRLSVESKSGVKFGKVFFHEPQEGWFKMYSSKLFKYHLLIMRSNFLRNGPIRKGHCEFIITECGNLGNRQP